MQQFDQWLNEGFTVGIEVPNEHLAVWNRRADMPKLDNITKFVADLGQHGVGVDIRMVDPRTLIPGQKEFDFKKVREMMEGSVNPTLDAPLYISKDLFVIDGHHRWLAAANNNVPILAHHVDMVFEKLIDLLNTLEYPTNRSVE